MAKYTFPYLIMSNGVIYSLTNWRGYGIRKMKQFPNSDGYARVHLTVNGKEKSYMVHKLIAKNFLPSKPSPSYELRHLDGNKLNNRSENLAWGTKKDNANDREKHGHTSRGLKHSIAIKKGIRKSTNKYWRHSR